ncbi:carbohydrate esterase family 8 protein [Athelia psychrophila]|uniref:Pectinesterase n=1 Tax=Athelia psychrophila TaxID=1759441 RepID=A0A166EZE0_9AGAM|nr:carbohydrate esterase family 8 protein [Fibularhizoctonia sp. CBS 109695]
MYFQTLLVHTLLFHLALAAVRTSPPAGALTVGPSGTYKTISAAVAVASKGDSIFIYAGTYNEAVYVKVDGITIYGATNNTLSYEANTVVITSDGSKATLGSDDASGTLRVLANSFNLYNVKVVNTYGIGSQALALSASGTEQGFYASSFVAYQDTVYTNTGSQYFGASYIEGAVDFIFGRSAATYIKKSTIASNAPGNITASGALDLDTGIYVFDSCTIEAAATATSSLVGEVYLGRPWAEYARVVFLSSSLSSIINPLGWNEWSAATPNLADITFAEYNNTGAGSVTSQRVSFSEVLSSSEATSYSISKILGTSYTSWVDADYL